MKNGWQESKFGDICDLKKGKNPALIQTQSAGFKPYLSARYIRGSSSAEFASEQDKKSVLVSAHEIIIICDGSNSGETFIGFDGVLSSTMAKIVHGDNINNKFLMYFLSSLIEKFQAGKTGSAIPHLDLSALREERLPVPPISEQNRIVVILDDACAGIATARDNAEQNLKNARELFESHLQSVFTQRGEGWVDRKLDSLCHEITVGHVGSMKTEYKESGIPFLRSQNIRPFKVSMDNAMFIDENFHRTLKKSQLRPGDLAIVRTGYPGTAAVIPPELLDANCSDLVIVRPGKEVSPYFLAAFFNSNFGKELVLGKIVGAAQKHFNVTAAKEVMLHVPPIMDQHVILKKIDAFRTETLRLESIYQQKIIALDELKKVLLHKAFSGAL